jgi:hypothetical protein
MSRPASSETKVNFEILNIFKQFGRTSWTESLPIARSLPSQDGATQKKYDKVNTNGNLKEKWKCILRYGRIIRMRELGKTTKIPPSLVS